MYIIEKHNSKELYYVKGENFNIINNSVMTLNDYINKKIQFGAHPEVDYTPQENWKSYKLWFDTEIQAINFIDYIESILLIKHL